MATPRPLSRAARRLAQDIEAFEVMLGLSHDNALELWNKDPDGALAHLRSARDQIVRSEVLSTYTLVDELMGLELRRHFFGAPPRLGRRAPRMRTLNRMLSVLYPMQKLELIEGYKRVPKGVAASIRALNETRNAFAHSFFFEDRRGRAILYKKIDIFKPDGMARFQEEMHDVATFLAPHVTRAVAEWMEGLGDDDASEAAI